MLISVFLIIHKNLYQEKTKPIEKRSFFLSTNLNKMNIEIFLGHKSLLANIFKRPNILKNMNIKNDLVHFMSAFKPLNRMKLDHTFGRPAIMTCLKESFKS